MLDTMIKYIETNPNIILSWDFKLGFFYGQTG